MFARLREAGEEIARFSEWVRLYPMLRTRRGRKALFQDILLVGSLVPEILDEMIEYAEEVLDLASVRPASEDGSKEAELPIDERRIGDPFERPAPEHGSPLSERVRDRVEARKEGRKRMAVLRDRRTASRRRMSTPVHEEIARASMQGQDPFNPPSASPRQTMLYTPPSAESVSTEPPDDAS